MRSEAWSRRRLSERRGRGGETHREGFSPDAMEEDASAAVGDSGELRQEEIQRWWVWIGGMTIIAVEILPSVYGLSVAYINTHDLAMLIQGSINVYRFNTFSEGSVYE
ncbi:hypothetical protein IGI04_007307 [Brassica rapa subsp. trilocularis]|uniref:Uncharacterized protein n=1 Tax=Brassica rapa subsp. trilocularis TaxID=1813537 RepID=A0ABQ7NJC7_BRACM|nr:hypothetical protein IGI04_007307 [Brassica rapa subsp. trilocularis]